MSVGTLQGCVQALERFMPPVEAFGIGGSQGQEATDELSDLDFFVLLSGTEIISFAAALRSQLSHHVEPVAVTERGFMADFGYHLAFIYDDNSMIDAS